MSWSDPHNLNDTCTPYYGMGLMDERYTYSLYSSPTSTFSGSAAYSAFAYRNGTTSFSYDEIGLAGGLVYWRVEVEKDVLVNSVVTQSLSRTSSSRVFTVCLITPPNAASPLSPNGTVFERCNITTNFEWSVFPLSGFGTDCSGSTATYGINILVGTDPSDLASLYQVPITDSASGVKSISGFQSNTVYYWQIETFNGAFSNFSEIFSFQTPDFSTPACSGHGTCNVQGTCDCDPGYDGGTCGNALPTSSPPDTLGGGGGTPLGLIIGVVVGAVAVILVLAVFAFFMMRRKLQKGLERPARQPPSFPPLAFVTPPGYPALAAEKIVPWYSFEQLLVVYGFALPFAILDVTQATEIDDVVKSLVYIIESHGQGAAFIKALISKDIKEKKASNTLTSATLFRDNSHASKAFKYYAKIIGLPYLFYIFGDAVYDLCTKDGSGAGGAGGGDSGTISKSGSMKKSGSLRRKGDDLELGQVVVRRTSTGQGMLFEEGNFEVDPNKMAEDDDILSNALFLQLKCQKLLVRLFRSSDIFPAEFSDIFVYLMREIEQSLSREDGYNAVAAFIFLRLVNPSILFPNQYGLTDMPPQGDSLTRQLILITKVLQNLANGVHFGGKEQHMAPLNDIIDSNKDPLRNFLDGVISKAPSETAEDLQKGKMPAAFNFLSKGKASVGDDNFFKALEVPRPTVESSLMLIYNHLHQTKPRALDRLKDYRSSDDVKIMSNKVNAIMDAIGEPIVRGTGTATLGGRKKEEKE